MGKLSIIAPTYNEAENVERLIEAVSRAMAGRGYEIIIADDDSPDLTWALAEKIAGSNPRVRVLRRRKDPGLGFAVIDGFVTATGDAVACIDADLQHDPAILPDMLEELEAGSELIVGCRYMPGGGTRDWDLSRRFKSQVATKLAQWLLGVKLRDPMSGYFMMRRMDFLRVRQGLNGAGFKILLEIVFAMQAQHIAEVPYMFSARVAGASKLSTKVVLLYLRQLWRLRANRRGAYDHRSAVAPASSRP